MNVLEFQLETSNVIFGGNKTLNVIISASDALV